MKFHHLGIAAANMEEALQKAKSIFNVVDCSEILHDSNQNVDLCMLTVDNGLQLELICGSSVVGFVHKRQYLYHSCFQVGDLDEAIEKIISSGGRLVSPPKEAVLFGMKRVAFVFSFMGIVELLEE